MPESGAAAQAASENASSRSSTGSRRSRYNNTRNQHLAAIASASSKFKGKIKNLAIIGKAHEKTTTYEKFIEEVKEHVSVELDQVALSQLICLLVLCQLICLNEPLETASVPIHPMSII